MSWSLWSPRLTRDELITVLCMLRVEWCFEWLCLFNGPTGACAHVSALDRMRTSTSCLWTRTIASGCQLHSNCSSCRSCSPTLNCPRWSLSSSTVHSSKQETNEIVLWLFYDTSDVDTFTVKSRIWVTFFTRELAYSCGVNYIGVGFCS